MRYWMKRIVLGLGLVAVAVPASAADTVMVLYGDQRRDFRGLNVKELSLCGFKRMVASAFGLQMERFDLLFGNYLIKGNRTLHDSGVQHYATLDIREVTYSFQC